MLQSACNYQWLYTTKVYFLLVLHVQHSWAGSLWLMSVLQADGSSIVTPDCVIFAIMATDRVIGLSKFLPGYDSSPFHSLLINANHMATLNLKGGQEVQCYHIPEERCPGLSGNSPNDCYIAPSIFPPLWP